MEHLNNSLTLANIAAENRSPVITVQEKQGVALTNLHSFGSTCAGMAALANQAINEGELTIDTAQHLANISEKLQQESNLITQLLSELFLNGENHETDRG